MRDKVQLIGAIEDVRKELLLLLEKTGYNFNDIQAIKLSQRLDQLIYMYYQSKD